MGWIAQRTNSLSPVTVEVFLLTIPFIEHAYRTGDFSDPSGEPD